VVARISSLGYIHYLIFYIYKKLIFYNYDVIFYIYLIGNHPSGIPEPHIGNRAVQYSEIELLNIAFISCISSCITGYDLDTVLKG